MTEEEIREAVADTCPARRGQWGRGSPVQTPEEADVVLWQRGLLRFLEELEGDVTVQELREALE